MTRLIDADAIPWLVEGVGEIPVITKDEIDALPTVDAIPVEWIKEIMQLAETVGAKEYAEHLEVLLADWAEERKEE